MASWQLLFFFFFFCKCLLFVFLTETKREIFRSFCMGERFSLLSSVASFMWLTFSILSSLCLFRNNLFVFYSAVWCVDKKVAISHWEEPCVAVRWDAATQTKELYLLFIINNVIMALMCCHVINISQLSFL